MGRKDACGAPRRTALALCALLLLLLAPAAAHADVTHSAAEAKTLKALDVRDGKNAVIVFGSSKTIPANAVVTEAGDAMAHTGDRAGLRTIDAPVVFKNGDEPAYLFHEDRGPYQQFEHPGRVVLVGAESGDVRVSRELRWIPLVDGEMLPWFATAGSYEKASLRVFERGVSSTGRVSRVNARAAQSNPAQAESRRRVANALAAERSCGLRVSDTLGNFFDYGGVDRSRARLGRLLEQMERMNAGFVSRRYSRKSGRTPAAELARLITRNGCKDVFLYLAGSGYRTGAAAVTVGIAPKGDDELRLQDVTASSIEDVMTEHRDVTFKIMIDAPYGGRVAERLADEPNMAILLSAGGRDEASFTFVPSALAGGQVIRDEVTAGQLLEFTNRVVRGMEAFVDSPLDVNHALAEQAAGRNPSMMVWMLGRGLALGQAGAPALPTSPVIQLGGGFTRPTAPPFTPPGPPPVVPPSPRPNTAPDAKDATVTVVEDTPTTIPLTASDANGDALTYTIATEPAHGSLSGTGAARAYTPDEDFTGTDKLTFKVEDGRGGSDTATVTLNVTAVEDDAEIVASPGPATYTENASAVVVDDELDIDDVDTATLSGATVSITGGNAGDVLSFVDTAAIEGDFDAASGVLTLTGSASVEDYQSALRTVKFAHTGEAPTATARTITFAASGGSDARTLNVIAVNDAPVNTAPAAQTVEEDETLTFAPGNNNAISVADADAGTGALSVALSVANGTLSLSRTDGLTFVTGDGNGDAAMTFTGTLAAINAAMNGLGYAPRSNSIDADTLTILTNDQGNTGTGGALTATRQVPITVGPVNDAPVVTVPLTAQTLNEDATKTLSGASAPSVADEDAGGDPIKVTLDVTKGKVTLDGVAGLTFTRGDGDNDAGHTFTGTIAAVNAALDGLVYAPNADVNGTDTLTVLVDDQGSTGSGGEKTDSEGVTFAIDPVNDAPVNTVPGGQTLNEDATQALSPSVADLDAGTSPVQVTLDVTKGILDLKTTDGLTFTRGDGTDDAGLTFTGTVGKVNAALDGLLYAPNENVNGSDTLTMVTSDQGNTGSGGAKTDTDTVAFTVSAVNDAPVNTVPGAQTFDEDTTKSLALSVADVDAGTDPLEVKLDIGKGLLDLASTDGLTFTRGDGNDDAGLTFTGTQTKVSEALAALVYSPDVDVNGSDTLTLVTSDQGSTGSGGTKTDTDTVALTISAVNDAPVNSVPSFTQTLNEDGRKAFGGASLISVSDVDAGSSPVQVKLDVANGVLDLGTTDGLDFTRGDGDNDAGLTFTGTLDKARAALLSLAYEPNANYNGSDTLTMVTSDQGNTGSGGAKTDTDTVALTINAVNDAPVNTVPGAQTFDEDTTKTLAVSVADVDAGTDPVEVKLDVTKGLIDLATTDGLTFTRGNGDDDAGLTFTGTRAKVNDALAALVYSPNLNVNGSDTLTVVTSDQGSTGSGGTQTDTDTVALTISAVNDAPVNAVPDAQTFDEDAPKTLVASVVDVDAGTDPVEVKLDVAKGLIDLASTDGLTFTRGNGDDDAGLTFTGTLAKVNAALNGLVYTPGANVNGADTLTLVTSDQGSNGSGGTKTDTDTVGLTVSAVNDAPVNTVPDAQTFNEDAPKTLVASVADVDAGTDPVEVKLDVTKGLIDLASTDGLTFTRGNGDDDAGLTFTGTLTKVNAALNGLVYTPGANFNGADTLTLVTSDQGSTGSGGAKSDTDTVALTISAANDAPVNTVPGAQSLDEDGTKTFTASVDDLDADSLRIKLDVLHGVFDLASTSGLTFTRGDGDDDAGMTFTGTKAAINTALDGITYAPALNYNGADTFTLETNDLGGSGAGDEQADTDTVALTISAVNDAPVNTVPGAQTLDEDAPKALVASVADVDAGTNPVEVKLDVTKGLVDLKTTDGLTFSRGDGNDDAGLTFTGTLAKVNDALNGLVYTPNAEFSGADTLTLVTSDQGNTGSGGTKTDTDTVGLTVSAVNDAPVNTVPGAQTLNEDATKTFTVSVADAEASSVQVKLDVTKGLLDLAATNGLTFTRGDGDDDAGLTFTGTIAAVNTALAGLVYTPDANYAGDDTLTLVTDDQGASGSGGTKSDTDTVGLTIAAQNDAPTLTVPASPQAVNENEISTLTLSAADVDATTVAVTLGVLHGKLTLWQTAGLTFSSGANESGAMTFEGSLTDVNNALANLDYAPTPNYFGGDTLSASVNDKGSTGAGGAKSDSGSVTFAIAERNSAPVNSVPGEQTFDEDVNRVFSTANGNAITFSDPDAAADDDIETRLQSTHGTLDVTGPTAGLSSFFGDGTNDVTLRGTMSELAAALEGLVYDPDQDYNGSATINVILADLGNRGAGGQKMDNDDIPLTITAVNDAPVLTVPGAQSVDEDTTLFFNGAKTISVADADGGAGLRRVGLAVDSGELTLGTPGDVTFVSGANQSGAMTIEGTLTQLNDALATLKYRDAANASGARTLTVTADDLGNTGGDAKTDSETVAITVAPVNDAPTVALSGSTPTFTEDGAAVVLDNALTIADVESSEFTAARVEVTDEQAGDTLTFDAGTTGIADGDADPHVLALSKAGGASKADWEAVLQSVKYTTPSQEPGTSRTIAFSVNDGSGLGPASNKTLTVVATPDRPIVTTGDSLAYTENGAAKVVDSTITIADDNDIASAQVRVSDGHQAADDLSWTDPNGAAAPNLGSDNDTTDVLTLTGTASKADYEDALEAVKYASTSDTPSSPKTIAFKAADPDGYGDEATVGVTVTPVNDPPAITVPGTELTFTEGDSAKPVAGSIGIIDAESDSISGAEAEVTSGFTAGQDTLSWTDNDPDDAIVQDTVLSTASKIVLKNVASAAAYAAALANVTFANPDQNPADGDRVVTFRATDTGTPTAATGTATRTVDVEPVDDPPVAVNDSASLLEDAPATTIDAAGNDTDVDGGPKTVSSASDPANGTTSVDAGVLTYKPDANYCNTQSGGSPDTFIYTLNGGSQATVSVTVTCVNDAPVADDETFNGEDGAIGNTTLSVNDPTDDPDHPTTPRKAITGDILAGDTDVDHPASALSVSSPTATSVEGGTVTIEPDGDFRYTPDPADNCTKTTDSFDYTVSDGALSDTGTVTISLAGCVWYVKNDAATGAGNDDGASDSPFRTLAQAEAKAVPHQTVYVRKGTGDSTGYNDATGYQMDANERLIGEHEGLTVDPDQSGSLGSQPLHPATVNAHPALTASNADVIALDDSNEVRGFTIDPDGTGSSGIAGGSGDIGGGVIDDVKIVDTGTAGTAPAFELVSTGGTFAVTNLLVDNAAVAAPPNTSWGVHVQSATADFGSTSIRRKGARGLNGASANLQTSTFDEIVVTGSTTGGVKLLTLTGTTSIALGDGLGTDLDLNTSSGSDPALYADGVPANALSVDSAGLDNLIASGGPALDLRSVPSALTFDTVSAASSGTDGVNLENIGSTPFVASGGTLSGTSAGVVFDVHGGSGDITYPGTFSNNFVDTIVEITGRTGGTNTFSGSITDGAGSGGGIVVGASGLANANTAGTTTFSGASKVLNTATLDAVRFINSDGHTLELVGGNLDIDTTTGQGIVASGAGTIRVSGDNNTVNTSNARALSIQTTDLSPSGFTFRSVSTSNAIAATRADHGIFLDTTGTAGLTITGNNGAADSGGTIANTTAEAIRLNQTDKFNADELVINGPDRAGIRGTNVTDFTLTDSTISAAGDAKIDEDAASIAFNTAEAGVAENNVDGVVTITGNTLTNHYNGGVDILQESGTIADLFVNNNTISTGASTTDYKHSAIQMFTIGTASTVANVTDAEIQNNKITGTPFGSAIFLTGGNKGGTAAPAGNYGTSGDPILIAGNQINPGGETTMIGSFGIGSSFSGKGTGFVNILNNGTPAQPLRNIKGQAIGYGVAGDAQATYVIDNNHIVQNNVGIGNGSDGIGAGPNYDVVAGPATLANLSMKARVSNNSISQYDGAGIRLLNDRHNGRVDIKILNNSIGTPKNSFLPTIDLTNLGEPGSNYRPVMCATVAGNQTTGAPPAGNGDRAAAIVLWEPEPGVGNMQFTTLAGTANSATLENELAADNPSAHLGGGYHAGKRAVDDTAIAFGSQTHESCTHPFGMP